MQVFKFGGASVKDAGGVRNLTSIILTRPGAELLIVISAMGKITDKLEDLCKAYQFGEENTHQILDEIKQFHFSILNDLFPDHSNPVYDDVANTFVEIDWLLEDAPDDAPDYVYDQIVSIGELVSTKIVSAYLSEMGCNVKWIDARNFIHTDNTYKEGKGKLGKN
jgi:aspartate kinase